MNSTQTPRIFVEVTAFLKSSGITLLKLSEESGVHISTLSRLISRQRHDIASSKADALRATMKRLSRIDSEGDCHA